MTKFSERIKPLSADALAKKGIIRETGYRDNVTDQEVHFILYHIASGEAFVFHGSYYDDDKIDAALEFVEQFPETYGPFTLEEVVAAQRAARAVEPRKQ